MLIINNEFLMAEDIQKLHIASLFPSRFELQWEIPADCQKVKNFTIPIEKNYKLVENVR